MQGKPSRFQVLVGLKQANDLDLALQPEVFSQIGFSAADRTAVEATVQELDLLVDGFDYLESPEFLASIEGKGRQFVAMKRKLHTPARQAEQRARLTGLLSDALHGDEIAELLPPEKHASLRRLRTLAAAIS